MGLATHIMFGDPWKKWSKQVKMTLLFSISAMNKISARSVLPQLVQQKPVSFERAKLVFCFAYNSGKD